MTECSQLGFELPGLSGRKIEGNFEGGNVSSDGGLVLLRQVDRWIGLTKALAKRLPDKRDPDKIEHCLESMLRQRIYGLALGYEDLNDHDTFLKFCTVPMSKSWIDCFHSPRQRARLKPWQLAASAKERSIKCWRRLRSASAARELACCFAAASTPTSRC